MILRSIAYLSYRSLRCLLRPAVSYLRHVMDAAGKSTAKKAEPPLPILPPAAGKCFARKRLSALMTNYNHGRYIGRAMEAVCSQSRPPDEYLILDDASTDDSVAIIQEFAARYPFIRLIRKLKNEGHNRGITELAARATGDYIHSGAADDYMQPGFLERALHLAEAFPHAGIISGEMLNGSEWNDTLCHIEIPGWTSGFVSAEKYRRDYLEVSEPTCTLAPATIFRRDAFLEVGGMRKELGIWGVSFALQACALKYGMCYVDHPCYTWIHRKGGWTNLDLHDLNRSADQYVRYLSLILSAKYRPYFGEKFARQWFDSNIHKIATFYVDAHLDTLEREGRSKGPQQMADVPCLEALAA